MKRALIVKTSALGDIVHALPVAQYLKERHEEWEVDWAVEESNASLLPAYPFIDTVITVNTKSWRKGKEWATCKAFLNELANKQYDVVFDLQGNTKSGLITWRAKATDKVGFAKSCVPEWPNTLFTTIQYSVPAGHNIREDYLSLVQQYFDDTEPFVIKPTLLSITPEKESYIEELLKDVSSPKMMVCPGAAWKNKQLHPAVLKKFLSKIQKEHNAHFFIIWGTTEEKEMAKKLYREFSEHATVVHRLPLPVLQNLMDKMDLVIAMDSLPLHLAGMTSTKTYSFFGPSSLEKYLPLGEKHSGIQGSCPYGRKFEKRCPVLRTCSTGACIKDLSIEPAKVPVQI